jgi:enoyl-CoA hydratase/carnithine racemase
MTCKFEREGPVAVLTLSVPDRRNALSTAIVESALDCLARPEAMQARAIVVTGEGSAFCAGADIGDLLHAGWLEASPKGRTPMDLFQALVEAPQIVIAAVNGPAFGGGFELVLACDLAIASEESVFSLPELNHGVTPNSALSLLRPIVGERVALEMILSGRQVSAYEARDRGIVNAVVPRRQVRSAAIERAREFVTCCPPGALRETKRSFRGHAPIDWALIRRSLLALPQEEWKEGLGAFLERRKPDYETFWSQHERR